MIMYSLHPSQHFAPELVEPNAALELIEDMRKEGTTVHTATFAGRDGRSVTAFWTTDQHGAVATLWEYSYAFFTFNAPPTVGQIHESVAVQAEQDKINAGGVHLSVDDEYAVGE